jgi:hypothetical protein
MQGIGMSATLCIKDTISWLELCGKILLEYAQNSTNFANFAVYIFVLTKLGILTKQLIIAFHVASN